MADRLRHPFPMAKNLAQDAANTCTQRFSPGASAEVAALDQLLAKITDPRPPNAYTPAAG